MGDVTRLGILTDPVSIRPVTGSDAELLRALAAACPPLDVHTPYTYWVLTRMFPGSCFIAFSGDTPVGFVTSVVADGKAFLWQVGVLPAARGRGLSAALINAVSDHARTSGITAVETTVAPGNAASLAAFRSYAAGNGLVFDQVGSMVVRDVTDLSFVEAETIFVLREAAVC